MSILLDLAYVILALIASPVILFKLATSARWRAGLLQRFGSPLGRPGKRPCVWIHAASVGEVSAVNDDKSDNGFYEPVGRFPTIKEDEPPLHLLCSEYPPARGAR